MKQCREGYFCIYEKPPPGGDNYSGAYCINKDAIATFKEYLKKIGQFSNYQACAENIMIDKTEHCPFFKINQTYIDRLKKKEQDKKYAETVGIPYYQTHQWYE